MASNLLADTAPALKLHLGRFNRVYITLVGCGGTGSHIASGLISLAGALDERGVRSDIYLVDPDTVEPKNVGRQLFSPADVGSPKAHVLANRLNQAFGSRVGGAVRAIDSLDTFMADEWQPHVEAFSTLNLVIGAVDNPAARAIIAKAVAEGTGRLWWLDCGNENHSGQIALGNMAHVERMKGTAALGMIDRLPAPNLVYPDLVKTPTIKPRKKISCAEATAAGEQGLMVNRVVAAYALATLDAFLVRQDLRYFALTFDLAWGGVKPYTIDAPTIASAIGLTPKDLSPQTKSTRPIGRTTRRH